MSDIMFIVVPIFILLTFVFMILIMFSSKFRGKMMSKQIKATKIIKIHPLKNFFLQKLDNVLHLLGHKLLLYIFHL